jgi:hypothetical protein
VLCADLDQQIENSSWVPAPCTEASLIGSSSEQTPGIAMPSLRTFQVRTLVRTQVRTLGSHLKCANHTSFLCWCVIVSELGRRFYCSRCGCNVDARPDWIQYAEYYRA